MSCVEIKTKKYQTRKGPPYHANDCKGTSKKGNDGKEYVSTFIPKQKTYRWILKSGISVHNNFTKKKKGVKTYDIHDNQNKPFSVDISSSRIEIFKQKQQINENNTVQFIRHKKIFTTPYKKVFIGDNLLRDPLSEPKGKYPGNSILVKTGKGKYIYIGDNIYAFQTIDGEDIKEYYSAIGNSDVPYPYAVGEKYTYFMLDKKALPNELLDLKKHAYQQFYKFELEGPSVKTKQFKTKMIWKRRLWLVDV